MSEKRDAPKRILVTGATGTLGNALVAALMEAHHFVVANYFRDQSRALQLREKTGCELARADVSDENAVEALFSSRDFEAVFHLAALNRDALLPRTSRHDWDEILKINAQSAFLLARASLRFLPRGGHLVLVSSRVAERGFAGQSAYGASKAAVLGLMKTAAIEGRERGICVNALCPGFAPSVLSQSLSDEVLARREAENWLPDADAAQSFAAFGVWVLQTRLTGQILRPDCRI